MTSKAIDDLIAANEWRDISEAPREPSVWVLFQAHGYQEIGFWNGKYMHTRHSGERFWPEPIEGFRPLPDDRCAKALRVAVEALDAFQRGDVAIQRIVADALQQIEQIAKGEV